MAAVRCEGTIKPATVEFNDEVQEKAANFFRKAMQGLGTDEKVIIDVLTMYSNAQLQDIKKMYKTMFGKDLTEDLSSELSGLFEQAVKDRLVSSRMYDALCLRKAMEGAGTDEETLIDILCATSNAEINETKAAYKQAFDRNLEQDITDECSSHLKRLLISQLQGNRDESVEVDEEKVNQDAQELHDAGELQIGTDESVFNKILAARSYPHLKAMFEAYKKISGKEIEETITSETSGDLQTAYLTITKFTRLPQGYFAECLHKAIKGAGTDDSTLIRLIISRCEVDMVEIKKLFESMYSKSLEAWIEDDCSGDYGKLLLRLVTENR